MLRPLVRVTGGLPPIEGPGRGLERPLTPVQLTTPLIQIRAGRPHRRSGRRDLRVDLTLFTVAVHGVYHLSVPARC